MAWQCLPSFCLSRLKCVSRKPAHNLSTAFRKQTRFSYSVMLNYVHKTASFMSTVGNRPENNFSISFVRMTVTF